MELQTKGNICNKTKHSVCFAHTNLSLYLKILRLYFQEEGGWLWRRCFADHISSFQFLSPPRLILRFLSRFSPIVFLKLWGLLEFCLIGFFSNQTHLLPPQKWEYWSLLGYTIRFDVFVCIFLRYLCFITALIIEMWPIGYCGGCFVLAGIWSYYDELQPIKEMHQISH